MTTGQNSEIIRQLYVEATSRKIEIGNSKPRRTGFTQYTVSAKPSSLKAFNNFFNAVSQAFPDYDLSIENMIIKGDRVMVRYTISGTHKGNFMGFEPTNERIILTGIDIFRLDNGKVVEHWDAAHQMSALPQLNKGPSAPSGYWRPGDLAETASGRKQLSLST